MYIYTLIFIYFQYEAFPNTQVLQDKVTQKLDNELETSSAIQMLQEEILQRMH